LRVGVRGLFVGDARTALEVCDTRDFDGTLPDQGPGLRKKTQ